MEIGNGENGREYNATDDQQQRHHHHQQQQQQQQRHHLLDSCSSLPGTSSACAPTEATAASSLDDAYEYVKAQEESGFGDPLIGNDDNFDIFQYIGAGDTPESGSPTAFGGATGCNNNNNTSNGHLIYQQHQHQLLNAAANELVQALHAPAVGGGVGAVQQHNHTHQQQQQQLLKGAAQQHNGLNQQPQHHHPQQQQQAMMLDNVGLMMYSSNNGCAVGPDHSAGAGRIQGVIETRGGVAGQTRLLPDSPPITDASGGASSISPGSSGGASSSPFSPDQYRYVHPPEMNSAAAGELLLIQQHPRGDMLLLNHHHHHNGQMGGGHQMMGGGGLHRASSGMLICGGNAAGGGCGEGDGTAAGVECLHSPNSEFLSPYPPSQSTPGSHHSTQQQAMMLDNVGLMMYNSSNDCAAGPDHCAGAGRLRGVVETRSSGVIGASFLRLPYCKQMQSLLFIFIFVSFLAKTTILKQISRPALEKFVESVYVAEDIKLSKTVRNNEIAAKLKAARDAHQKAIDLIDTVLGETYKTDAETVQVVHQTSRLRSDDDSFLHFVSRYNPCFCRGAASIIQMGVNASHFGGVAMIKAICEHINESAPITREECVKFDTNLFSSSIEMVLQLTDEEVMCHLIHGPCSTTPTNTFGPNGPVTCTFCELLHKKSEIIVNNFLKLFDGFEMMCKRLIGSEKEACREYVKAMTNAFMNVVKIHFKGKNAEFFCKLYFKCV